MKRRARIISTWLAVACYAGGVVLLGFWASWKLALIILLFGIVSVINQSLRDLRDD